MTSYSDLVERDLREILAIVADRDPAADAQLAAGDRVFADQRSDAASTCRSRSVRSDPSVSPRISVPLKSFTSTRSSTLRTVACSALHRRDRLRAARPRIARHRPVIADRRAQSRQSLQPLATPLRLLAVLPRDVARDVVLLVRDLPLLLVELPLLRQPTLVALLDERCVAADVWRRRVALEVQYVIDDTLQETRDRG